MQRASVLHWAVFLNAVVVRGGASSPSLMPVRGTRWRGRPYTIGMLTGHPQIHSGPLQLDLPLAVFDPLILNETAALGLQQRDPLLEGENRQRGIFRLEE